MAKIKIVTRICAHEDCNNPFDISASSKRKFCSDRCCRDQHHINTDRRIAERKSNYQARIGTALFKARGVPSDNQHPNERVLHCGKFRIIHGTVVPVRTW